MKLNKQSREIAILAMFAAIIFILAFTPLGFIRLPLINATIIHIPVIIGSIMIGPKYGAILGLMFGLTSFINNTMAPNPLISFVFTPFFPVPGRDSGSLLALLICFGPRMLVGVVPWYVYNGLNRILKTKSKILNLAIAGVAGSLTNTLLVMHLIFFLFRDSYAQVRDLPIEAVYGVILGIIAMNGVPEAIIAGVVTAAVCVPLKSYSLKRSKV